MINGVLMIHSVNVSDAGMYQCLAENKYGTIYASAELKVLGEYLEKNKLFLFPLLRIHSFLRLLWQETASASPNSRVDKSGFFLFLLLMCG